MAPASTLILSALALAAASAHPIRQEVHDAILLNPESHWRPIDVADNQFKDWSEEAIAGLMGTHGLPSLNGGLRGAARATDDADAPSALPTAFDARTTFSSCSQTIRNQAHCGSCWAFAAAETLSENLCIQGGANIKLSPQDLVSCDSVDHGCQGGTLPSAWKYITNHGIVSDACLPYTSADGNVTKCAEGQCTDPSSDWTLHKCTQSNNMLDDTESIKNGVMQMGSAETGFYVYEDFMHYKSGVYKHDNTTGGNVLGGHAVRIVGWGTDAVAGKYWTVANSWGAAWGESGYFRIAFDDKDSGFALGGGFNCGNLTPAPPPTPPTPGPDACKDILPSKVCASEMAGAKTFCNIGHLECKKTCGCCVDFDPPAYCKKDATPVFAM